MLSGFSRREITLLGTIALLTAAAGVTRYLSGVSAIVAFILAGLALAGLAWIVSLAVEQVGEHMSDAITGTMHSTVGNLPEFFVVLFALQAGHVVVAETALLGSILVNALLVLGLVIIAGSRHTTDGIMRFGKRLPNDTATLMLVASFIISMLGVVQITVAHDQAGRHIEAISVVGAAALLVVYGVWMRQFLRMPDDTAVQAEAAADRPARLGLGLSVGLLIVGGTGSAFVSDWFVHALEPTINQLHISQPFAGLVIVAIAGNAVENVAAVFLAWRGDPDLAISIVKSSVAQIAAFLYPLLVIVSLVLASRLTFALAPVYVAALAATAILIWQVTGDGEATLFEGVALIAVYVVLATVASFEA